MAFVGKAEPAGPMSQKEIILLSFPVPPDAAVLKNIVPPFVPAATVDAPSIKQFVTVFDVASPVKRIVHVPLVVVAFELEIFREFPPVFNPSIVTLSAPFRL